MECRFPMGHVLSNYVRLPFTLPASMTNVALSGVCSRGKVLKAPLTGLNVGMSCARLKLIVTLIFIKVPFIVHTIRPILRGLSKRCRRTTFVLKTGQFRAFHEILLPRVVPPILAKFKLTFTEKVNRCKDIVCVSKGDTERRARIVSCIVVRGLNCVSCTDTATVTLMVLVLSFILLLTIGVMRVGRTTEAGGIWMRQRADRFILEGRIHFCKAGRGCRVRLGDRRHSFRVYCTSSSPIFSSL